MQLLWVEGHDRSFSDIQLDGRGVCLLIQALYCKYEREILLMYLSYIIRCDSELHGVGTYYDRCHHTALVWNPCLGSGIISKCHWTWVDAVITAIVALCSINLKLTFWFRRLSIRIIRIFRHRTCKHLRSHVCDSECLGSLVDYIEFIV